MSVAQAPPNADKNFILARLMVYNALGVQPFFIETEIRDQNGEERGHLRLIMTAAMTAQRWMVSWIGVMERGSTQDYKMKAEDTPIDARCVFPQRWVET